jgi:hypothetical protein
MTAPHPTAIVGPGRELVAGWATALAEIASGGARTRLRIAPGMALVTGRIQRARITVPGLRVADLELAVVDVSARDLSIALGWPVRLRAQNVEVRVRVEQAALDRWMRAKALPVRLVLRDGEIRARAGSCGSCRGAPACSEPPSRPCLPFRCRCPPSLGKRASSPSIRRTEPSGCRSG